jgi:hypothetical protein
LQVLSELPKFCAATSCLNPDLHSYDNGNFQNSGHSSLMISLK